MATEQTTPPEIVSQVADEAGLDKRTNELVEFITSIAKDEAARTLRRWTRGAMVGYLILLVGIGYAINHNRTTSRDARSVLCRILTQSDRAAYKSRASHEITAKQLRQQLERDASYRVQIGPAPGCTGMLTPKPKRRG